MRFSNLPSYTAAQFRCDCMVIENLQIYFSVTLNPDPAEFDVSNPAKSGRINQIRCNPHPESVHIMNYSIVGLCNNTLTSLNADIESVISLFTDSANIFISP